MKFTSILTNLILENSRFQVLLDKFVKPIIKPTETPQKGIKKTKPKGLMDFEMLKAIIFADPTTKIPEGIDIDSATETDMDNVKVGKFTQWLLKNFVNPKNEDLNITPESNEKDIKQAKTEFQRLFIEDLFKTTDDLTKFSKYQQYFPQEMRNIDKFTPKTLFNFLQSFQLPENIQKKREKTEIKKEIRKEREGLRHPGGDIVFTGNKWTVIEINKNKGKLANEAATWYGGFYDYENGESRWCTSPPNASYTSGYLKDGPLYVIFANDDEGKVGKRTGLPQTRYQFHFPSNQFMDRLDHSINLVDYLKDNGPMSELKDFFRPEFAKGLSKGDGTKLDINYPDSSSGKFIALYGFNQLFESVPDTIDSMNIVNKSKEEILLDVPPSITRFKNLKSLMLQNIVKTLPENIGDLKALKFISLPQNAKLVAIPESVNNLPDLTFLNLMNSNPNVIIPNSVRERLDDEGNGFYYLN